MKFSKGGGLNLKEAAAYNATPMNMATSVMLLQS